MGRLRIEKDKHGRNLSVHRTVGFVGVSNCIGHLFLFAEISLAHTEGYMRYIV